MSSTEKHLKWTLNHIAKSDDTQVRNMSMEEMSKATSIKVFRSTKSHR